MAAVHPPTMTEAHQSQHQAVPSSHIPNNPVSTYKLLTKTYPSTKIAYDALTTSLTNLRTAHLDLLSAASLAKEEKRLHGYNEEQCDQTRSRCEQSCILEFLPSRVANAEECLKVLVRHWRAMGQLVDLYRHKQDVGVEKAIFEMVGQAVESARLVVERTGEMVVFAREQRWEMVLQTLGGSV
jgi:hypothetical protein